MKILTFQNGAYTISTDKSKLDIPFIHQILSTQTYWAKGIPLETVETSIRNSLCYGVFESEKLVGFARVITDYATIAYLGDVFILEEYRGIGLSKWMMEVIVSHPNLQGLRRWILLTSDAHGLYEKVGFNAIAKPEVYMEKHNPDVYKNMQTKEQ